MKGVLLSLIVLLIWGAMKQPWEASISDQRTRVIYGEDLPMSFELRETLGQELTLAALGGFRGLVATFLWISLTENWQERQWTRVRTLADFAVTLQPRVLFFWENGAWHLAWNASVSVKKYAEEGKSEARKEYESRQWIEAGIEMLERGIRANPEKANLYQRMAELYWQRLEDYEQAAHYYRLAAAREGAPSYVDRFIGYALEKAGKMEQAYAHWQALADAPDFSERKQKHRQKVMENLAKLEAELGGPPDSE
jgi:tetratricopeptide (TPR) repeat protein